MNCMTCLSNVIMNLIKFYQILQICLGVHSKATNFAVFSELGQFPMLVSVIARCISFWIHTIQSTNESLLSKAYWEQCNNPVLKSSLLSFVKNVLTDLGFSHVWNNQSTFNASALLTCIKTKLKERFISFWGLKINSTIGMDKLSISELFCLCCVEILKNLPVHLFNALIIPILRDCLPNCY